MTCWVGAQGEVNLVIKAIRCSHCDVTHRKPKMKILVFQPKLEDLLNL